MSNLKQQINSVHAIYNYSICDYSVLRKHLKTHIEAVHEEKKTYKSSFCDYSASQIQHLKTNVELIHQGTIKSQVNLPN